MIKDKCLTVGDFKKWIEQYDIADDTPIWIYIGDSERGSAAYGIIGETKEIIDDNYEPVLTELTGEHCYCKDGSLIDDVKFIVMIIDGYHYE